MGWRLLPLLAVRTTGFPTALLTGLRCPDSTAAVRRLLDAEAATDRLRQELLGSAFRVAVEEARTAGADPAALRALSAARRAVGRGRAVGPGVADRLPPELGRAVATWAAALRSVEDERRAAEQVHEREATERRRVLHAYAGRPDVQEALLLSNPAVGQAVAGYAAAPFVPRPATATRKLERRLVWYLQRFCAKNETQSYFGPVNYGRLDPANPATLTVRRSPTRLPRRETFGAQWVAEALAGQIGADPELRSWLRPRRGTACVLRDGVLRRPGRGGGRRALPGDAELLALCDGTRTVRELAAALGEPDVWSRLERLRRAGAVITGPVVPPDRPDPLGYLAGWLARVPGETRWSAAVGALRAGIADFGRGRGPDRPALLAALEREVTARTGLPARRGAGRMYADRGPVFEECRGDLDRMVLGGALAAAMTERLPAVLRLAEAYAVAERARDRQEALDRLRTLDPPGTGIPLLDYLADVAGDRTVAEPPPDLALPLARPGGVDALDTLLHELDELVERADDGHRAVLAAADLPVPDVPDEGDVLLTSVDVMVAARSEADLTAGRFTLVVGEVHPPPLLWVFPTAHFLGAERAELDAELAAAVTPEATQIVHTRTNKIFPYPLPGHSIELRPRRDDTSAVPAAEVEVRERDGAPWWWAPSAGWMRLYPPLHRAAGVDPVAAFSFPAVRPPRLAPGRHSPRIEVDGIVLQRERWEVAGGPLGPEAGFGLLLAAWRLKERLGLPDQVYVRAAQEPKPVFVDFTAYVLVEVFARLLHQSDVVVVTEALPSVDESWLTGPEGVHCCEFRLVAVGGPDDRSARPGPLPDGAGQP